METDRKESPKKETSSEVRMVVEVDGNPVGILTLDIDRLWPLINHRKNEPGPVEWMDPSKFDAIIRAAVIKRLMARLQTRLYPSLGDEMVKAEIDVESFILKAEAAAQVFGRTKSDIDKLAAESERSPADFYNFFWEFLLDERDDVVDLKKEWKAAAR
jgi:hypothetical protein